MTLNKARFCRIETCMGYMNYKESSVITFSALCTLKGFIKRID